MQGIAAPRGNVSSNGFSGVKLYVILNHLTWAELFHIRMEESSYNFHNLHSSSVSNPLRFQSSLGQEASTEVYPGAPSLIIQSIHLVNQIENKRKYPLT